MNIDFITFIGRNSSDYAEYLKYTCELFLSNKHHINWKCIRSVGAERLPKNYDCVAKSGDYGHNSTNHGMALNLALKYIESEYVIFVDCDMAVLYPNWDDVVVNELNKYDCFGTAYDDPLKYQNFPMIYFFGFRKYILDKVDLDFRPKITTGSEKPLRFKLSEEDAKYFGKKPGELIKCDTGYNISYQIQKAGFKGKCMNPVLMKSKYSQLPFENEQHKKFAFKKINHNCEWHYKKKLFTTHKQASRSHPLYEKWGMSWKKRVDLYIKEIGR